MNMTAMTYGVLLLSALAGTWGTAAELPHIVIVYTDDLGFGDLSIYNPQAAYTTPRIDRMAREGILFTDAHSPSTICSPSRYGLYSGQQIFRSTGRGGGAFEGPGGPSYLKPGTLTLGDMLRAKGYRTGVFGKWHVGLTWYDEAGKRLGGGFANARLIDYEKSTPLEDGPNNRGFDESYVTPNCPTTDPLYVYIENGMVPAPATIPHKRSNLPNLDGWLWDNDEGFMSAGYDFENADKIFYGKTVDFITNHLKKHKDKPFLAVLCTQIAHAPVLPAEEFRGKTDGGPRGDFVRELDVLVGRLLDKLDELGVGENTLVLFGSDNGPETVHYHRMRQEYNHNASGGWRGMKRDGWEGGHRVPFIARWPRAIPAGQVSKQMTNATDIFATLASVVGYELKDEDARDSYDLLPVMLGLQAEDDPVRRHMLTQSFRGEFQIRQGEWKYLDHKGSGGNDYDKDGILQAYRLPERAPDAPGQLYNLKTDPGETTNLYFKESEKRKELQALLSKLKSGGRSAPTGRKPIGIENIPSVKPTVERARARSGGPDADLSSAIDRLKKHMLGASALKAEQIDRQTAIILENIARIGATADIISEAFDLVACYESTVGPLFLNEATRGGFLRKPAGGLELDRALFVIQQGLIDHAFAPGHVEKFRSILDGAAFKTSSYFPGAVDAPSDPAVVHEVAVDASQPLCWGIPVMDNERPARRPTGCYLPPGCIANVTVPRSMVGRGYGIRVGAHSWDFREKPKIVRLDRVSIVYPIEAIHTAVANPLGGGIYIEVPYQADAGIVKVSIANAVRAPFFSARHFDRTTLDQWKKTERHHPGPWADFESDKFMMQVPTKWIYNFDAPVTLMEDWDTAMDAVSELFGLPLVRPKTVLYLQVDVILRGNANYPGYPQSNFRYDPLKLESGHSNHWLLKGPQSSGEIIFHELGHAHLFTKFRGEVEAVVNLPYVAVLNRGFGVDLNTAFGRSFSKPYVSLEQAAIMWMVTENFRNGKPMDISNSPANEVRYQHRGYGKYVEIAHLFGWKPLQDFWHSVNLDYLKGIEYPRNADPTDSRILRMSRAAGADLRPLIHFWGIHPEDNAALEKAMAVEGLEPSPLIYDRLLHYTTLIPMNNADFVRHAEIVNPEGIREGRNPLYGEGWYYVWLPKHDESHGRAAQAALREIIDLYFPKGRPRG